MHTSSFWLYSCVLYILIIGKVCEKLLKHLQSIIMPLGMDFYNTAPLLS